jgi:anti-sigma factor RsiW
MEHDELKQLLSAHALMALDDADRRAVEEHLLSCTSCVTELGEWHSTAAALALAAESIEPSPAVRERIMSRVREEQRHVASTSPTKVIQFVPTPRKNLWTSMGSFGTIAASVGVLALLVSTIVLWRQKNAAQAELTRVNSEILSNQQQQQRDRELISFLSKPGTRVAELAGTNVAQGARATIAYDTNGAAMLVASGLPLAPTGKAYQLWFIVGNRKLPGRVFTTDSAGNADSKDQVPTAALGGAVFAVTLEPAGGMSSPTGDIFLLSGS